MSESEAAAGPWITATTGHAMATEWGVRAHRVASDEPPEAGGADAGPSPIETMLGALAACTTITGRMYADRKGWPLESITARARRADAGTGPASAIELEVQIEGPELTGEQRERIRMIAARCPVHRTLETGATIRTS